MSGSEVVYVVVGFRIDSDKSVYYKKCRTTQEMLRAVAKAFEERGAQFISIRRVVRVDEGWYE